MNREIKFRAFSKISKVMLYNGFKTLFNPQSMNEDQNYIVMQFTGLCDINDTEIYEGDTLKILKDYTKPGKDILIHGTVSFSDASFYIKTSYGGHYRWMDYKIEVIGNMYENKDLP